MSQSLTSLKKKPLHTPPPVEFPQDSPEYIHQVKLAELRRGIELALKEKDDLEEDIKNLNKAKLFLEGQLESKNEVKKLKDQKLILLRQIKELKQIIDKGQADVKTIETVAEETRKGRIKELELESKKIATKLDKRQSVIDKKLEGMRELKKVLDERNVYLNESTEKVKEEFKINFSKTIELKIWEERLRKTQDDIQSMKEKTNDFLTEAEAARKEVLQARQTARKREKELSGIVGKERKDIEKREAKIGLKEKEIKTREATVEKEKKRLKDKEIWLEDKERTLVRSAREVERKAQKANIMI